MIKKIAKAIWQFMLETGEARYEKFKQSPYSYWY